MNFLKNLNIEKLNPGAYCGYTSISNTSKNILNSVNPATDKTIAEATTCSLADYQQIIGKAEYAFTQWRLVPAPKRGDIIRQIGDALRKHKNDLGSLVSLEMGKSKQEGDGEVQEMIDIADLAVGQSRMLYGKTMHSERHHHRMYEQWHPYGVVGIISAFNFPVAVWAWNAFIAAICGNVTIWKPSAKTPLSAIATHKICAQVLQDNQCPDIFNLFIPESHDVANAFVEDNRVPLISFTGSTPIGRQVGMKVAARLGRSILELGGNNAIILDETADLRLAIPGILFGAIGTSGQRCTSTRRLFVQNKLYESVLKQLKNCYKKITIGDPLDTKNLMGPLIDINAVDQFKKTIQSIQDAQGEIVFGGKVLSGPGYFVEPTLVTKLNATADIVKKETFAPILYVFPYETIDEAIELQNSVPQGLSSSLFTQNLKNSEVFLSASGSDCGIANINIGTSGAEIGGAFGGEKETGGGRESGSDAWKSYMRRQTNTINWGNDLPLAQGMRFNLT